MLLALLDARADLLFVAALAVGVDLGDAFKERERDFVPDALLRVDAVDVLVLGFAVLDFGLRLAVARFARPLLAAASLALDFLEDRFGRAFIALAKALINCALRIPCQPGTPRSFANCPRSLTERFPSCSAVM